MTKPSEEEWTTVTKSDKKRIFRQGKKKGGGTKAQQWQVYHATSTNVSADTNAMSSDEMEKMTAQCQRELRSTKFFSQLQDALLRGPGPTSIVCYGLGNFGLKQSEPSASMWQLACALQLRDLWKKEGGEIIPMYYFEPCILEEEVAFLGTQAVDVITENEKGRRLAQEPTFFYMPHCPLGLYANLLFTNVTCLEKLLLLGNSLSAYANRLEQNPHTQLLGHLQPFWDEAPIEMPSNEIALLSGQFEQGFNDSAVTFFAGGKDQGLPTALSGQLLRIQDDDSGEVM